MTSQEGLREARVEAVPVEAGPKLAVPLVHLAAWLLRITAALILTAPLLLLALWLL